MKAYRSTVCESSDQTPIRIIIGHEMRMPIVFLYPTSTDYRASSNFQSAVQYKLVPNSHILSMRVQNVLRSTVDTSKFSIKKAAILIIDN